MSFKNILGQDRAIGILKKAISNNSLYYSYIFSGIDGIGKKLTALTFAKTLNCKNGSLDSCDKCSSCLMIDKSSHPDIILIEPEENSIKIDQVRRLQKYIHYRPLLGNYKIVIMNELEKINLYASNALLKTLEEPPNNTVIILVIRNLTQLQPTIISRCHKVLFQPIPFNLIVEFLKANLNIDTEKANFIASLSQGSIGKALKFNSTLIKDTRKLFLEMINSFKAITPYEILNISKVISSERQTTGEKLDIIKTILRDAILLKLNIPKEKTINLDIYIELMKKLKGTNLPQIIELYIAIDRILASLIYNANIQLSFETNMLMAYN